MWKAQGTMLLFQVQGPLAAAQTLLISEGLSDCPKNALGTNWILSGMSQFAEGWNCLPLTAPLHSITAQIARRVFPCRPWSEITDAEGLPEDTGESKNVKHLSLKGFPLLTLLAFLFLANYLLFLISINASTCLLPEMLFLMSVTVKNRDMHSQNICWDLFWEVSAIQKTKIAWLL